MKDVEREQAAANAGLPLELAARLQGENAEELEADARNFAAALSSVEERPYVSFDGGARQPGPMPPPTFGSLIRAATEERNERLIERASDFDRERNQPKVS
jgi:hypothetical protein